MTLQSTWQGRHRTEQMKTSEEHAGQTPAPSPMLDKLSALEPRCQPWQTLLHTPYSRSAGNLTRVSHELDTLSTPELHPQTPELFGFYLIIFGRQGLIL